MDSPSGPSASGQSDCGSQDNSSFGLLHSLDTLRASGQGHAPLRKSPYPQESRMQPGLEKQNQTLPVSRRSRYDKVQVL